MYTRLTWLDLYLNLYLTARLNLLYHDYEGLNSTRVTALQTPSLPHIAINHTLSLYHSSP
jgi:hypothetical protein